MGRMRRTPHEATCLGLPIWTALVNLHADRRLPMKISLSLFTSFALLLSAPLLAQVPQLISYQGRVGVDGVNFDGQGQFKFALVNAAGTTTYWSNDSSSNAGSEPGAAVSLAVSKGLYAVLLGDATLSHMTIVPATVFTNGDVHLRVWFNDGVNGFQQLMPDRRIAAVGYAMMADSVPDGAITTAKIANGAVTTEKIASGAIGGAQMASGSITSAHLTGGAVTMDKIANGAVSTDQLAAGAVSSAQLAAGAAAANLNASGQSGVASGGLVLSTAENPALVSAGYTLVSSSLRTTEWKQKAPSPLKGREGHTVTWTGSEMIIWGGSVAYVAVNDGARFNPMTNSWQVMGSQNAPSARSGHSSVWTGTELIVWGGHSGIARLDDGGRYNPATDTWTPMSSVNAPSARIGHSSVWTGTYFIVWGGSDDTSLLTTGARYNPVTDIWTALGTAGAPSKRSSHTALWTGSQMIIWGGSYVDGAGATQFLNNGARYNPPTNTWGGLTTVSAPRSRSNHASVWTGTEVIVWGGHGSNSEILNDCGIYNPSTNSWRAVDASSFPLGRFNHTAVWTGSEMMVWGGTSVVSSNVNDGARYNPVTNLWTRITETDAPIGRANHHAIWTGAEMLIWGGASYLTDTPSYKPGQTLYLYQRP